jgi:hypothetical protein
MPLIFMVMAHLKQRGAVAVAVAMVVAVAVAVEVAVEAVDEAVDQRTSRKYILVSCVLQKIHCEPLEKFVASIILLWASSKNISSYPIQELISQPQPCCGCETPI